jgi:hypothetical protein
LGWAKVENLTVSFFSHWQPLRDEDAHTALVFGFLRHAPTAAALDVWLSRTLGRPVASYPLTPSSFWPNLVSVVPGLSYTEPELVFEADDGEPLTIIVEVKPGYDMHTIEQVRRELVDVATAHNSARVACLLVGADLAQPSNADGWLDELIAAVEASVPSPVAVELRYSSFASIGRAIEGCGQTLLDWGRYAEDVVAQLRKKGLMGYEGAPMLDDLESLNTVNAVEGFNRTIRAARQFYLLLHTQSEFAALQFAPLEWNFRMLRNGRSDVPTQLEAWFETTVILSQYRHSNLPDGWVLFVAFDLLGSGSGDADMIAGLGGTSKGLYEFANAIQSSENLPDEEPFRERANAEGCEWLYDRRPWRPGLPDEDVSWALARLAAVLATELPQVSR